MTGNIYDFNDARVQGETHPQSIDIDSIRERVKADVKAFVHYMYGGRAYASRGELRIGDVDGNPGSSLSISIRDGVWRDHATGEGGDIIDLYAAWRGYGEADFILSMKEIARDFLRDPVEVTTPTWQRPPREKIELQKAQLGDKPREENLKLGAPSATYRYYDLHGGVTASVVRFELEDGSKTFRPWCFKPVDGKQKWVMGAPDLRPLYNLPEVAASPVVVLVEGEKCVEALRSIGVVATTAMQGAKAPIEKTDWSHLSGKTITIWPDHDEPGIKYAQDVAKKLLTIGCRVLGVTPPAQEAKGWDVADCIAVDANRAHEILAGAMPIDGPKGHHVVMLDLEQMENVPKPVFLIDGVLTTDALSVVWGPSGSLKTFVGVDFAMSVACGMEWHGRAVRQGMVVYISAESRYGCAKRCVGWAKTRGRNVEKKLIRQIPMAIDMTDPEWMMAVIKAVMNLTPRPSLIVIDTLARTLGAKDENKQQDMGVYVAAADNLRIATGAHVMIVHHSGRDNTHERGSTVLRGAADTMIKCARKGKGKIYKVDLINDKQKEFEEFSTIKLQGIELAFDMNGEEAKTILLEPREDDEEEDALQDDQGTSGGASTEVGGVKLSPRQHQLYGVLEKTLMGLSRSELEAQSGVPHGSFWATINALEKKGLVFRRPGHVVNDWTYYPTGFDDQPKHVTQKVTQQLANPANQTLAD